MFKSSIQGRQQMMKFAVRVFTVFATVALSSIAHAVERVALIVSVDRYDHLTSLNNPGRDARGVADLLSRHAFAVTHVADPTHAQLEAALKEFETKASGAEEAIVYFAGHGMAAVKNGRLQNIVAPRDAKISCADRGSERVMLMEQFFEAAKGVKSKIFLFDACRNDPFLDCPQSDQTASRGFGFRVVESPVVSTVSVPAGQDGRGLGRAATAGDAAMIVFSTDLGALALDGKPGANSPFAEALVGELSADPGAPIREVLDRASQKVAKQTSNQQMPWVLTKGGEPAMCLSASDCKTRSDLAAATLLEQSRFLADAADQAIERGDAVTGMLLALEALPEPGVDRPLHPKAKAMLDKAMAKQREVQVYPHENAITGMTVSPDETKLVTYDEAGAILVWDVAKGNVSARLEAGEAVTRAEFSPDGKFLAAILQHQKLRVWQVPSGKVALERPTLAFAWHPKGANLAFDIEADAVRSIILFDMTRGVEASSFTVSPDLGGAYSMVFSPDAKRLLVRNESVVSLWNVETRQRIAQTKGFDSMFGIEDGAVAFSPDGALAVFADNAVNVMRLSDGKILRRLPETGDAASLSFSRDGRTLLVIDRKNVAQLWDTRQWKLRLRLEGHADQISSGALSRDGNYAFTIARDGTARQWNAKNGEKVDTFALSAGLSANGVIYAFNDSRRFLTLQIGDRAARLWSLSSGDIPYDEVVLPQLRAGSNTLTGFATNPELGVIAELGSIRFNADVSLIAITTLSEQNAALVIDVAKQKVLCDGRTHYRFLNAQPCAPNILQDNQWSAPEGPNEPRVTDSGRRVKFEIEKSYGEMTKAQLINLQNNEVLYALNPGQITLIKNNPYDGSVMDHETDIVWDEASATAVVSVGGYILKIDAKNQSFEAIDILKIIELKSAGTDVFLSTDLSESGRRMVVRLALHEASAASQPRDIFVIDLLKGSLLTKLRHIGATARISPTGDLVATVADAGEANGGGRKKTIKIWSAETGSELRTFANINDAFFGPNGDLLTLTHDLEAKGKPLSELKTRWRIYRFGKADSNPVEKARGLTPRCLTTVQRAEYFLSPEPPRWCVEARKWPYDASDGNRSMARDAEKTQPALPAQ